MRLSLTPENFPHLYIAGPMRGIEKHNFPAFDEATAHYRKLGFKVESPAEYDRHILGLPPDDNSDALYERLSNFTREDIRRCFFYDTGAICNVDAIILLPDWEFSTGVAAEIALARVLGIPLFTDKGQYQWTEENVNVANDYNHDWMQTIQQGFDLDLPDPATSKGVVGVSEGIGGLDA